MNITAALAVKKIMEREKLPGTIRIWPGAAEELVGTKAYFVRDGLVQGRRRRAVHARRATTSACRGATGAGTGLVSVEYTFRGETAHAAGAPWRGRSALDAVELMNIGWNYRREHLRLEQRSHYVVTDGGDQPNVVPRTASVWYYFRETDVSEDQGAVGDRRHDREGRGDDDRHRAAADAGARLAPGRSTSTSRRRSDVRQHPDRSACRQWSEADQTLAKALQKELGSRARTGLDADASRRSCRGRSTDNRGGGSDDIGDISWNVPTVTLRFPVEHPGPARTQLGERDRDGDADRAQGRDRRRQGAGDDDARPAAEARRS